MEPTDRKRFAAVLTSASEMYGKPYSSVMLELWWSALEAYDMQAIEEAMARHMRNPEQGRFMPKPADLVAMIDGGTGDAALVAWAKVDRAVRDVGTYETVAFDDPLIHRVLHDMGGWLSLGSKTETEWPFVAREFQNRYRGFRMRGEVPDYPAQLPGLFARENAANGYRYNALTLIGDPVKAHTVAEQGKSMPRISHVAEFVPTALLEHAIDSHEPDRQLP